MQNNAAAKTTVQKGNRPDTSVSAPVPEGVHQAHSELFHGTSPHGTLMDREKAQGDVSVIVGDPMPFFSDREVTLADFVTALTCKSGAVVTGMVLDKSSFLTKDQDWVFTDHDVQVEDILKNNAMSVIVPNDRIVIALSGGMVNLSDGHMVRVIENASFEIGGKYLLFLEYVPQSGGYISRASFLLKNGRSFSFSSQRLPNEAEDHSLDTSLLYRLIGLSSQGCASTLGKAR